MKHLGKILLGVAVVGGVVMLAGGGGNVVAEGVFQNAGDSTVKAKWKVTEKDGVLSGQVKLPGESWNVVIAHGNLDTIRAFIDRYLTDRGFIAVVTAQSVSQTPPASASLARGV